MVEPVKSILLVDLDGLGRGLAASAGEGMDRRLAERIDDWTGAIESGELIEPAGTLRAIVMRRCYVGSRIADETHAAFARAGFDMVECDGQTQVELCLAVDAMEAAADTDDALDFILLTAAPNLTPLVERLRARGNRVAVYVSEITAADYRAAADLTIAADELAAFLTDSKAPQAAAVSSADRSRIEAFAREVHAATNIPMFSPKTFADLFRILAAEVTQNGYHFNETAKNVAERLTDAGRNVTSRQVVFVVKGLALKGYVFSTSDTPERLAEVFREQARYLIGSAGITLDDYREGLLKAWIAAPPPAAPAAQRSKPARPSQPPHPSQPPRPSQPAASNKPAPRPAEPVASGKPAPRPAEPVEPVAEKPARKPPPPERRPEKPAAAKPATPPRVPERPKSAALPAKAPPPPPPSEPTPASASADLKATIAARIAASAKMKPGARPPMRTEAPAPSRPPAGSVDGGDAIESSILAAIAEAVDVLVDNGGEDSPEARQEPPRRETRPPDARRAPAERPPAAETPPPPPPAAEDDEEGGDIGDEIQRIVASYNRNRDDERR